MSKFDPDYKNQPMNTHKKTTEMAAPDNLIRLMAIKIKNVMIRFMHRVKEDSPVGYKNHSLAGWKSCHDVAGGLLTIVIGTVVELTLNILLKPVNRSLMLFAAISKLAHILLDLIRWLDRYVAFSPGGDTGTSAIAPRHHRHWNHLQPFPCQRPQIIMG